MESTSVPAPPSQVRTGARRWLWFGLGWCAVAVGSIGIVVPGLPTTVFFIVAASCFARSSPRFEQWVLGLPSVGPLVRDYRAGLGMSRRAKAFAISTMVLVGGLSVLITTTHVVVTVTILVLLAIGVGYVAWRVPTRERVLADRARANAGP
ncbi:MAG: YbaN family protein [Acidimicrobiia bacterium]